MALKKAAALLALWGLMASPAPASAPTTAQKQEFYRVCLAISGDELLCTCKADAAVTLIDERMMAYVIAGMKGSGSAPEDVQREWNDYVARSNQICKPNY